MLNTFADVFSFVGIAALAIAIVGGLMKKTKIFKVGGLVFLIMIAADSFFGIVPHKEKTAPSPMKVETPAPKVEQSAATAELPAVEKIPAEWSTVPDRICKLPSIGSTRADFDNVYKSTDWNSVGHIRYNNDVFHAKFFDGTGDESADKQARAFMIIVQPLPKEPFPQMGVADVIPTDSSGVTIDDKGSDAVVRYQNIKGTSNMLAVIFPKSFGKFYASFQWDVATGKFIGGTVTVDEW